MDEQPVPDHVVELRPSAPVVRRPVAVIREELVLQRRSVGARAPKAELGRGEVRVAVVREHGRSTGSAI